MDVLSSGSESADFGHIEEFSQQVLSSSMLMAQVSEGGCDTSSMAVVEESSVARPPPAILQPHVTLKREIPVTKEAPKIDRVYFEEPSALIERAKR